MPEAMSLGTAVVTSPVPALVEVAGGATLVAPDEELASALRSVVDDDALRSRLEVAGRSRAAGFTWDGVADALWTAYGEIGVRRA
jgi:glycosyltransferase involved in cell wall biosynthesis